VLWLLPIIKVLASFIGNVVDVNLATPKYEHQQSPNTSGCCILYNPKAVVRLLPVIKVLATVADIMVNLVVATPNNERQQCVNPASTEH